MTGAPLVGLFATCLVDALRPTVGFAAARLLMRAGCRVEVPRSQVCCGQPAYNAGDRRDAAAIARRVVDAFERFDHVVAPSGSCAGMLRVHYPALLDGDRTYAARARALAARSHELVSFLIDVMKMRDVDARFQGVVTYHDSCCGLRELGVKDQPRRLLATVDGLVLAEMTEAEVCCGFGGTFCVKYPAVSAAMATAKARRIDESGAACVLAGDLGCLMNIAGMLSRQGIVVEARHVAEVLADMAGTPAIGAPKKGR